MNIAIVKYNAGNIHSVRLALQRLGINPHVTDSVDEISRADKVIFPGVGEASSAMHYLGKTKLDRLLIKLTQPVLGICLGLQLLCRTSEENNTACLSIFDLAVKQFPPGDKVPHMGWNTISGLRGPLFKNIAENSYVYFVHSYYAQLSGDTCARTKYIVSFSSALQRDNFFAVQFHPEKSGKTGEQILKNFLEL